MSENGWISFKDINLLPSPEYQKQFPTKQWKLNVFEGWFINVKIVSFINIYSEKVIVFFHLNHSFATAASRKNNRCFYWHFKKKEWSLTKPTEQVNILRYFWTKEFLVAWELASAVLKSHESSYWCAVSSGITEAIPLHSHIYIYSYYN